MQQVLHSINRIREVAPQLNQVTDEANRVVAAVEKLLNEECSLGVPCEIEAGAVERPAPDDRGGTLVEKTSLVYARVHGRFRLAVKTIVERSYGPLRKRAERVEVDIKPWPSCSREQKLVTFPKLPALLQRIASEADAVAERTAHTSTSVQEVLAALRHADSDQTPPAAVPASPPRSAIQSG